MSKKSGAYRTINDDLAEKIKELHERHPNLGAKGLLNVLKQKGSKVDPKELERFISEHGLKPKSKKESWRPSGGFQAPWDR